MSRRSLSIILISFGLCTALLNGVILVSGITQPTTWPQWTLLAMGVNGLLVGLFLRLKYAGDQAATIRRAIEIVAAFVGTDERSDPLKSSAASMLFALSQANCPRAHLHDIAKIVIKDNERRLSAIRSECSSP